MESILTSIKQMLGLSEDCTAFDVDIITHINSTFMILRQLGVGPSKGFSICDSTAMWTDFVPVDKYVAVKSYMYLKVKLLFDSASLSSAVIEAMNRSISEYEWRLNHEAEYEEV